MSARDHFFNLYGHGFARVAVATPLVRVGDPAHNLEGTLELMRQAARAKAVLAVFPELGLSAYSCEDLFHQQALIGAAEEALERLARDGPLSVYQLAKRLARDYKNVHTDVARLAELGLIARGADGRVEVQWSAVRAELRL